MRKKANWFLFFLLLSILSYAREVMFRSINALIEGSEVFYQKTTHLTYLDNWTNTELIQLKIALTAFFSIAFIALTLLGLKFSFKSKKGTIASTLIYAVILIISVVLLVASFIDSDFNLFYPHLRTLLGFINNPLIYILVSIGIIATNPDT